MLTTGQYPNFWKQAEVVPVPKTPQPMLCKDYRPISLLFHLGKLAEQVLINKIRKSLNSSLMPHQYAYLPNLGTTDAILQLIDDCTKELDAASCKYMQLACLDFSKAFDRLQPSIVLQKMESLGINQHIINILHNFLKHRKQCVRVHGCTSDLTDISVGAPQGTKLGPILWLFYVNDLSIENFNDDY
jgi:hypothetical protein